MQPDKGKVSIHVSCSPTAAPMFEVLHLDCTFSCFLSDTFSCKADVSISINFLLTSSPSLNHRTTTLPCLWRSMIKYAVKLFVVAPDVNYFFEFANLGLLYIESFSC